MLEKRLNHDATRTEVQIFKNQMAHDCILLRRRSLYPFNYENIVRKTYLYRITKIRQNSKSESDWSKIPA